MAITKVLGKIAKFSYGIDSDGVFGATIDLTVEGGMVLDLKRLARVEMWRGDGTPGTGAYFAPITPGDDAGSVDAHVNWLAQLLFDSKRRTVDRLAGVPIEATLEDNMLRSWRVLTEVL